MTKVRDREQLVEAAAKLFAERGFEATRLEDIASEFGVHKGSLYYHISGKGELLYLVVLRILKPMIDRLEEIAVTSATPREKLAAAVRAHLQHFDEFYRESTVLFVERALPLLDPEHLHDILDRYHRYEALLRAILRAGIDAGEIRADLDITIVMLGLLGMCNWVQRWYQREGRLAIDAIADIFVCMLLEGLQVGPPAMAPAVSLEVLSGRERG